MKKTHSILYGLLKEIWENPSNKGQRLYRFFLAILWQFYKRTIKLPLIVKLDNNMNYVLSPDSSNSTGVIYSKIYEAEYILFIRKLLSNKKNDVLIDVGAHSGLFALLIHPLFTESFLFEPAKDNFKLIERNVALNPSLKIKPENVAVSDKEGFTNFLVTGSHSGTNKIVKDLTKNASNIIKVPIISIDSYLRKNGINNAISLIKIDTEGHEHGVLKGAEQTIRNNKEIIILFENSSFDENYTFLSSLGMNLFGINKDGSVISKRDELKHCYNLFALNKQHDFFNL